MREYVWKGCFTGGNQWICVENQVCDGLYKNHQALNHWKAFGILFISLFDLKIERSALE